MQLETRSPPGPLDGRLLCRIRVCMCSWRLQAVLVLGRRFGGHSDSVAEGVRRRAGVAAGSVGWGIVQEVAIAVALERARAPVVPSPDGPPSITCHGHASVQLLLGSLVPPAPCLCLCCRLFSCCIWPHLPAHPTSSPPTFFAIRSPPALRTAPERCCVHSKTLNAPPHALLHWAPTDTHCELQSTQLPPIISSRPPAAPTAAPEQPGTTAKLSPILLNRTSRLSFARDPRPRQLSTVPASNMSLDAKEARRRRSSSIVYKEPAESLEQLSDQAALPNLNANWVHSKGMSHVAGTWLFTRPNTSRRMGDPPCPHCPGQDPPRHHSRYDARDVVDHGQPLVRGGNVPHVPLRARRAL
jgi:hypothetical protein